LLSLLRSPPEQAAGVVDHAGAVAEFDQAEHVVDVGAGEQDGIREIHNQRSGGVVAEDHIAGEKRSATAHVEKARATCAGEAQDASNDVGWASGDIGDDGALAAAGGPTGGRAGLG
jgi:hypothetical protein